MIDPRHPVDAAISALVTRWKFAPELVYDSDGTPVQLPIIDGQLLDDPDLLRFVLVGTGGQFAQAASTGQARRGYGGRRTEQFDISCELHVWSGDTDLGTARGQAYGFLTLLERSLARDSSLGDVVDDAGVTRHSYTPAQSEDGVVVVLAFTVTVAATRFD